VSVGRFDVQEMDAQWCGGWRGGEFDGGAELGDGGVEMRFLGAPGVLLEPCGEDVSNCGGRVGRKSLVVPHTVAILSRRYLRTHQKSINGSISDLGVPCSHSLALGSSNSCGKRVNSSFFFVQSKYFEET
jgi:hypothetical protein